MSGMMLWVNFYHENYGDEIIWMGYKPPIGKIVFVLEKENSVNPMMVSADITNFIPISIEDMSHIDYVFYSNTLKAIGRRDRGEQIKFNSISELEPLVTKLKEDDNDLC